MPTDEDPLVVVAAYMDLPAAYVAKGLLQSEGIDAVLRDEHLVTANWMLSNAVGGIRLAVPQSQLEDATALLAQVAQGERQLDEEEPVVRCPRCGSDDVAVSKSSWQLAFASLMFLNIPLPFTRTVMKCARCGNRWKSRAESPYR